MAELIAIDPVGCGCTECLTGQYVPLDQATDKQVRKMLKGKLRDHTSEQFEVTRTWPGDKLVSARAVYSGYSWTWED